MNRDQIIGRWKEIKGSLRERYGELTDDELEQAKGNAEQLAGLLQRKYGKTKEDAEAEIEILLR